VRRLALVLAAAALAGCGGGESGKATLWVTRDRGNDVILRQQVPAGLTAMQALDRAADIDTRYGGRFVQSVNGISGSLAQRRDWFYFINGYEGDRSASEYKLRPGDVEWWDFRSWKRRLRVPAVVGAFPEPFLHGYGGKTRKATIVYDSAALHSEAVGLAKLIHAKPLKQEQLGDADVLYLTARDVPFTAQAADAGSPVRFTIGAKQARRLLADPKLARFRYEGLP
jgi:hypothetical protein